MGFPAGQRDFGLSSSVPARGYGWKSNRFGDFTEGRLPQPADVKRWDGAARECSDWNSLRRDHELWYRSGNCFVHLYGPGQSRRGPAFKVPFSTLLAVKCHPLIERYLNVGFEESAQVQRSLHEVFEEWNDSNPTQRIELYIPAPPGADKVQAFQFHLATRNLFAWIFRRSLVGGHLGHALVELMNSLREFRLPGEDNVEDLVNYMDEEGYLDMRDQPNHALAVLHLAEQFQLKDLYVNAFAHCAGMSDRLPFSGEYEKTSAKSRKLIRRARAEMDLRLAQAGSMLRTFLEDELSEAHLGLATSGRAHMERFRSFLLTFYSARLGYYPPSSPDNRSPKFETAIFQLMHDDFDALYEFLVDETFTSGESTPLLAQGGICAIQSVQSFDIRYRFKSLNHPLPLLPEIVSSQNSRRMSWLSTSRDKLRPDQRLLAHASLVKATNSWKTGVTSNELVKAYRKFEEESIVTNKVDRAEKINLVDARKVRWILIYDVYQILRDAVVAPPQVRDVDDINYNIAVSTADLPPWDDDCTSQLLPRQTDMVGRSPSTSTSGWSSSIQSTPSKFAAELKPDIDYFALAQKSRADNLARSSRSSGAIPRSQSLSRSISKNVNGTFRRSLSVFRKEQPTREEPCGRRPTYHEIVVHGYGNGTNEVCHEDTTALEQALVSATNRSLSTASNSSAESGPSSTGSTAGTSDYSPGPPTPQMQASRINWPPNIKHPVPPVVPSRGRHRDVVSYIPTGPISMPTVASPSTTSESFSPRVGNVDRKAKLNYAASYEALIEMQEAEMDFQSLTPSPLCIKKDDKRLSLGFPEDPDTWGQLGLDFGADFISREVQDEWEQYTGLGGHTPVPFSA